MSARAAGDTGCRAIRRRGQGAGGNPGQTPADRVGLGQARSRALPPRSHISRQVLSVLKTPSDFKRQPNANVLCLAPFRFPLAPFPDPRRRGSRYSADQHPQDEPAPRASEGAPTGKTGPYSLGRSAAAHRLAPRRGLAPWLPDASPPAAVRRVVVRGRRLSQIQAGHEQAEAGATGS